MLELLDDRVCIRSTFITSQLLIEHWQAHLGDSTFAHTVLDRIVHAARNSPWTAIRCEQGAGELDSSQRLCVKRLNCTNWTDEWMHREASAGPGLNS